MNVTHKKEVSHNSKIVQLKWDLFDVVREIEGSHNSKIVQLKFQIGDKIYFMPSWVTILR